MNKRFFGGKIAQRRGQEFETFILNHSCPEIEIFRIENGCINKTQNRRCILVRVKQPFDFILTGFNKTVCLDAKSIDSDTFPKSAIDLDQLRHLNRISKSIYKSGYLIFFRPESKIVFYNCKQLSELKKRESLKIENGILVGTRWNLNLEVLFKDERQDL